MYSTRFCVHDGTITHDYRSPSICLPTYVSFSLKTLAMSSYEIVNYSILPIHPHQHDTSLNFHAGWCVTFDSAGEDATMQLRRLLNMTALPLVVQPSAMVFRYCDRCTCKAWWSARNSIAAFSQSIRMNTAPTWIFMQVDVWPTILRRSGRSDAVAAVAEHDGTTCRAC